MLGLRSKILLGFGGLLLILLTVGLLGVLVVDSYRAAMEQAFDQDYDSVAVCQQIKESIEQIDILVQNGLSHDRGIDLAAVDRLGASLDQLIKKQQRDVTLEGESQATAELLHACDEYLQSIRRFAPARFDELRRAYLSQIRPQSLHARQIAQQIIDMNIRSMRSQHGRAADMADRTSWVIHMLTAAGVLIAVVFSLLVGRMILRPVRLLTQSVHEVERGNLDQELPIQSRDELGRLAAAFNDMAAQLRRYRQAERDLLLRTQRSMQLAIDSLPDAVVVLGPDGLVEMANQNARRLMGVTPGAEHPAIAELLRRIADGTLGSGYESTLEVQSAGQRHALLPRTLTIHDETGRVIGRTLVLSDVTELRCLDEMKSGLLSLVSHELKTPLTSARMILHLITDQKLGPLTDRQADMLGVAREDVERLHRIVENLLDMDRIESGRALMELQPTDPAELARAAVRSIEPAFAQQQVALRLDLPPNLPPVHADPVRIGHVLANLLRNALRHTPSGGEVMLTLIPRPAAVEFAVRDSGGGVPPQFAHRVFEKFFRVSGDRGSSLGGSGLGLSLCKEIVEAHHGQISLRPTPGQPGATFVFTLPVAAG